MNSALRTAGRSRVTRVLGSTAAVSVAFAGVSLLAAPSAQAATAKPVVISAPKSVAAGTAFKLTCNIKPASIGKDWKGSTAVVREQGVPIRVSRVIGAKGACSMRLILNVKGTHKFRVVARGPQNTLMSSWITIKIK